MALLQKLQGLVGSWSEWLVAPTNELMIGKYRADYSRLTLEEIAQEDADLTKFYANSRHASG
jgi:hypothetical protein